MDVFFKELADKLEITGTEKVVVLSSDATKEEEETALKKLAPDGVLVIDNIPKPSAISN